MLSDMQCALHETSTLGVTMNVLAERLAPLRARMERQRAAIRPVSRVWLELSDKTAFERCIELCLDWMERRSEITLPKEAREGRTFDVTDVMGANPTKAVRVNAVDGSIWAARLDFPDPNYPRTWVSEFFSERRIGHLSRFGAQLTCVVRGESPNYDITRPNVVRRVLETLSAEADGWPLADVVPRLDKDEVSSFEQLLYDQNRRLPVIAISEFEEGKCRIEPSVLARQVAGAAHIVHLSSEASWELTRSIGKRMSVFNGAVRLYLPTLSEETEDPYQHPLWLLPAGNSDQFVRAMSGRVLPFAFLQGNSIEDFPRFSALRDFVARQELATRPSTTTAEHQEKEIDVLKVEIAEVSEERDAWQSLAQEEQSKRLAADADVERLKGEILRLEAKAGALQHSLEERGKSDTQIAPDRSLLSYDDLEDWADEVLADRVYIHQAALKDCKKKWPQRHACAN
jgi:hypothetical protein